MKTHAFALLLKSYSTDLTYARRLVSSFQRFNPDGLHLYCVVPSSDLGDFSELEGSDVTVMDDSPFVKYFTQQPIHGIRSGYINQEIVKLAFWELGLADNYFCVDSEAVVIRDLHQRDFISPDGYPYTVLTEDKDLEADPFYYEHFWQQREQAVRLIACEVGLDDPVLRTCHGHQVFSSDVLRSFKRDFLEPRGWTYLDALSRSTYEFTWYNFWLQKTRVIPVHQREPFVKVLHHEQEHIRHILSGIKESDLARSYAAVVVNSNFSRDKGMFSLSESKPKALSPYLSYSEVATLIAAKLGNSFRRLLRRP